MKKKFTFQEMQEMQNAADKFTAAFVLKRLSLHSEREFPEDVIDAFTYIYQQVFSDYAIKTKEYFENGGHVKLGIYSEYPNMFELLYRIDLEKHDNEINQDLIKNLENYKPSTMPKDEGFFNVKRIINNFSCFIDLDDLTDLDDLADLNDKQALLVQNKLKNMPFFKALLNFHKVTQIKEGSTLYVKNYQATMKILDKLVLGEAIMETTRSTLTRIKDMVTSEMWSRKFVREIVGNENFYDWNFDLEGRTSAKYDYITVEKTNNVCDGDMPEYEEIRTTHTIKL